MGDPYFGFSGVRFEGTGFFRVEEAEGRWWFVTPDGNGFLSHGVNHVQENLLTYPYNEAHWKAAFGLDRLEGDAYLEKFYAKVRADLAATGWNTLSCHNADHLYENVRVPYIPTVRFVDTCHWMTPADEDFLDVWSPAFEAHCEGVARRLVAPRAEDRLLLGYSMTDCPIWSDRDAAARETCIYGAKREGTTTWPRRLRNLDGDAPGKRAYVDCVRGLYQERIEQFNGTYGTRLDSFDGLAKAVDWRPEVDPANARELFDNTAFLNRTVDRYYAVTAGTIRRHDPNHMVFGDKLNGNTDVSDDLLRVVSEHCDVLFWQHYANLDDHHALLDRAARATGMPQLNGDASLSCPDERLTNPLGPHYPSQPERASAYRDLMRGCYARSDFLGWDWCGWLDRWAEVQPMRQHSGVQDAFGNQHSIVAEMKAFSEVMYDVARGGP